MPPGRTSPLPRRTVRVRVPATTANLGPGFDCMGIALEVWDEVTLAVTGAGPAPDGPGEGHEGLVVWAAGELLRAAGRDAPGLSVGLRQEIPVGRGLGSSAAAIVAGVVGANALAGAPLGDGDLADLAARLEGHPDNSTPCLFGGFQVCALDEGHVLNVRVPLPPGLGAVLFIPDFPMPTHETRKLLPEALSRADVVFQTSRAALLVAALAGGHTQHLRAATQDRLHQPARGSVFRAMGALFEAALGAGALCAYLSGGGPTVLALVQSGEEERVRRAMAAAAGARGVGGDTRVTRPSEVGAQVLEVG